MRARNTFGAACIFCAIASHASAADRDYVEDSDFNKTVQIEFNGTDATITNGAGVTVTTGTNGASISIVSEVAGVEYLLSGTSTNGYVEITSNKPSKVTLAGLDLTSSDGPAVSVTSEARTFVVLAAETTNSIQDASSYERDGSGTLYSSGPLIFSGKGSLDITGTKSHAIYGGTSIRFLGGNVTVSDAVKDGVHCSESFQMDQGSLTLSAQGDGIDGDEGTIVINGGTISDVSVDDDTKGIACDGALTINGGLLNFVVEGDQSKALKSDSDITINGGSLAFNLTGGVYLESVTEDSSTYVDPSYCTAIKCGGNLAVNGGQIEILHSGLAGKGISTDGNMTVTGGEMRIFTSGGSSATFTNGSGERDIASADCVKSDGNLTVTGGSILATSTGTAGDAISCDGAAVLGVLGNDESPVISANTTGAQVAVSGSGQSADYANPKAIKSEGAMTINGGSITATTQEEGGEGLESKSTLTINGGTIEVNAYDDGINAATKITVTGGNVYSYSSGNDGIDSNGTFAFSGGTIISSGTTSPEEGFDCDSNNFAITGGTLIGTGGATSTPTSSSSTQKSVIYKGTGTADVILQVKSSSGNILVYKLPRTYSGGSSGGGPGGGGGGGSSSSSMTMLFSTPTLASGTTYTLVSGATVSGGTEFHGLYTGATVTGGTTLKTFTTSSTVTTVQ
ncbi:carbohydrate-binding domain-containing protein [Luteolibacter pohnpeiensis]|uniref:Carbohydrate-binding domain-containing protein n=1 Tax=Luteolibacter pohnpeiensis TaxID=454153 RepID=A0A934S9L5_9BACT|nr:carbohydrate-binding domain-containing protein [Luteolibacter pohnpeiensis]MBK1881874.1 carbohydrate-binding domain-containing protein [Luteolibacter pohnpeiensis]